MFSEGFVNSVPLLYGGSVSHKNACDLAKISILDGVLVGSASLSPDNFFAVLNAFAECI